MITIHATACLIIYGKLMEFGIQDDELLSFYKPDPPPHSLPSHGYNDLSSITLEPVVEVGCVEDVVTIRKRV